METRRPLGMHSLAQDTVTHSKVEEISISHLKATVNPTQPPRPLPPTHLIRRGMRSLRRPNPHRLPCLQQVG